MPAGDGGLAGGDLAGAGLEHLAHDHGVDLVGRDAGPFEGGGDGPPSEVGGRERREAARELADRRTRRRDDHRTGHGVLHPVARRPPVYFARPGRLLPAGNKRATGNATGRVGGRRSLGMATFEAHDPTTGAALGEYPETPIADVAAAAAAAERAFAATRHGPNRARVAWLTAIADAFDAAGDDLLAVADTETALGPARLTGEWARTRAQVRAFAALVADGSYVDAVVDAPDPDSVPPRGDLRRMLVPIGPVANFAASNFPFAFSVPGGDTIAALAAGCPVVVKAHPSHPETSRRCAALIAGALAAAGAPDGMFAMVEGASVEVGAALVVAPEITAVAFTGSLRGGRALYDLAATRPVPIPVYAEMGSVNPVFVTPAALARARRRDRRRVRRVDAQRHRSVLHESRRRRRSDGRGRRRVRRPGLDGGRVRASGAHAERDDPRRSGGAARTNEANPRCGRCGRWRALGAGLRGRRDAAGHRRGDVHIVAPAARRALRPGRGRRALRTRRDGPRSPGRFRAASPARSTPKPTKRGATRCSSLRDALIERVGRLVWNGFPTGVAIAPAMHHGGPYPATTHSGFTSVGQASVRRFLRPVTFQDVPDPAALPVELRS